MTKRTQQRCKNPAAYGCKACRMHGAHKSRNVLRGKDHPRYRNGERTKEAEIQHQRGATVLLTLRDIGDSIGMFNGSHTKGRKPFDYVKFDLTNQDELILAIIKTMKISA